MSPSPPPAGGRWRYRGPGVLKGDRFGAASPHLVALDPGTTLRLARAAADRIRSGLVALEAWPAGASADSGPGTEEAGAIIFVSRGKALFRFGPHREFLSEAEAGDAVFVPLGTGYGLENAAPGRPLEIVRIGEDGTAEPASVEAPATPEAEEVLWVDPIRAR